MALRATLIRLVTLSLSALGLLPLARRVRSGARNAKAFVQQFRVSPAVLPKGQLDIRILGTGRAMPPPLSVDYGKAGEEIARHLLDEHRAQGRMSNLGFRAMPSRLRQTWRLHRQRLLATSYRMSRERLLDARG